MIPDLILIAGSPWKVLPPGIHRATLPEVGQAYATNRRRKELFAGLVEGAQRLRIAGCACLYLDGSFVTGKPKPGDFDACWDPVGVEPSKLDPVFKSFANGRAEQKAAFKGEFFPSSAVESSCGRDFIDFFQVDKFSGEAKGIVAVELTSDPLLEGGLS